MHIIGPVIGKSVLLLFAGLIMLNPAATAGFDMNANCRHAYEEIIGLKFSAAEQRILAEKRSNPTNDAVIFLDNKILFLKAFISEEQTDFQKLKTAKDEAINVLKKGDPSNPYYTVAAAEILMQTAVVKIKFREFFSGALEVRKAYRMLESNRKTFPGFIPGNKGIGILHALIGAVPENYKWIVKLVGMDGNIRQGIGELKKLLDASANNPELSWLREETLFMLIYAQHHLLKDDATTSQMINSVDMTSASPLIYFVVANFNNSTGNSARNLVLLGNYKPAPGTVNLPFLNFMRGSAMMFNLDASAAKYFQMYVDEFRGQNFIKAAYQKLSWISILQGDTAGYRKHLGKARTTGNDFVDEDKQALNESLSDELPNTYLLRSRLLFDGGYYQRSLSELGGKKLEDFPRLKDQLELTYRMGRIFDKLGQKDKAKNYYESTFINGQRQTWYFAANAALHLAILYEVERNLVLAREWYYKCQSLRNHEYQNSIDQKAEAGLNRIGK